MIRPYSLLHENEKSTCCSLLPPCFLPLYIESKIIPSSTIPDQEPNKIDSYYESLSLQNSHAHIRTYSQESRSKKILHIYTSMDQYSSSLVDTSLDLTIGITRMRVEEDSTTNALVDELKRVNAENKKLSEMLTLMCDNYNVVRKQLMEYVNKSNNTAEREQTSPPKKRKSPARDEAVSSAVIGGVSESSSTDQDDQYLCKKQREETVVKEKVSRVYYKTEASDTTLVVKDGYQWRKYGQKVTRDNPSPRAYFKCACAPSCAVKKKVQRSVEDQSVLVATYEGEHNHPMPSQMDSNNGLNRYVSLGGPVAPAAAANGRCSLAKPVDLTESKKVRSPSRIEFPEVQKLLVEQMASSLTRDPNFTAALAAAVTGRLYQKNQTEK
ncbi:probable WRKY transcription factor 40 [Brassica rapa]|nr:probable WRKY transcription factor 40 [Brassica rapa]